MSPTPPTVLLDRGFIEALVDAPHDDHVRAATCYRRLVERYEQHEIRLRALADHVGRPAPAVLAPVERIHVAGQYRRAAARLELPVPLPLDFEVALTLVIMRREGITRIATLDPTYTEFDLTVLPADEDPDADPLPVPPEEA